MNSPVNNTITIGQVECPPAPKKSWRRRLTKRKKPKKLEEEPPTCPICMECFCGGKVTTKCGHEICVSCYTTLVRSKREMPSCPMCRQDMAVGIRDIPPPDPEPHPDEWMNEWNAAIVRGLSAGRLFKITLALKYWELSDLEDLLDEACNEISCGVTHHDVIQAVCDYTKNYLFSAYSGNQLNQGDWDHVKYEIGVLYTKKFLEAINKSWTGENVAETFKRFRFRNGFVRPTILSLQEYPAYMTEPDELLTPTEITRRTHYINDMVANKPKEMIDYYDSGISALFEENEEAKETIYQNAQSVLNNIQDMEENLHLETLFPEEYDTRDDPIEEGEIESDDDIPELVEEDVDDSGNETDEQEPNSVADDRIGSSFINYYTNHRAADDRIISSFINWEPNHRFSELEFQELLSILVSSNTNASE